jgi:hypothetical protein
VLTVVGQRRINLEVQCSSGVLDRRMRSADCQGHKGKMPVASAPRQRLIGKQYERRNMICAVIRSYAVLRCRGLIMAFGPSSIWRNCVMLGNSDMAP